MKAIKGIAIIFLIIVLSPALLIAAVWGVLEDIADAWDKAK